MVKTNIRDIVNYGLTGDLDIKVDEIVITDVKIENGEAVYYGDGSFNLKNAETGLYVDITGCSNTDNNGHFLIKKSYKDKVVLDNPNAIEELNTNATLILTREIIRLHTSGSGSGSGECNFSGNITEPSWGSYVEGTTCQDFVNLFFATEPPIMNLFNGNPSFGLYEYNTSIDNPILSYRATKGSNGADLDKIEVYRGSNLIHTETPANYDTVYNYTDNNNYTDTVHYSVKAYDVDGRVSNTINRTYEFTWPYFGTSSDINTLTKQNLVSLNANYFQVDMVAETTTDKQKAEFYESITITGVQFYNTVSGQWEWLNGSKTASLDLWDTSTVVKDINGTNENYTRYTHNGSQVGARQLRFWRV